MLFPFDHPRLDQKLSALLYIIQCSLLYSTVLRYLESEFADMTLLFTVLASLLACTYASPTSGAHILHEKRETRSSSWSLARRAAADTLLPVRVGLKQSNVDKLYERVMEVSDPDSKLYGKHWSPHQVAEYFRPSEDTLSVVKAWLVDGGFTTERMKLSNGGHWLQVNSTVAEAEKVGLFTQSVRDSFTRRA